MQKALEGGEHFAIDGAVPSMNAQPAGTATVTPAISMVQNRCALISDLSLFEVAALSSRAIEAVSSS
jgi:hypothetical protein